MRHALQLREDVLFLSIPGPKQESIIRRALSGFVLKLIVPSLLVSGASALAQTSFYVATNGSDSNAGTLAAPFLTLAKAQSAEQAAGTGVHRNIYIRGGEYFNVTMLVSSSDSSTAWIG
ncbi:MAG: hypothetical protein ABSG59_17255, partial [Verrucomicrobiota bacterium]